MFGPLGTMEILFILVLALLVFGPRRLPEVGRTIGKALGEFRRATTDLKRSVNAELAIEEERPLPRRPSPPPRGLAGAEAGAAAAPLPRPARGTEPRAPAGEPTIGPDASATGEAEKGEVPAAGEGSREREGEARAEEPATPAATGAGTGE